MKKSRSLVCILMCLALVLPLSAAFAEESTKLSPEPVTLNLMVYEHASAPWMENPVVIQEIFEKTNIKLNLQVVPQSDYTTKLNVLLSTNQMPDIVKTVVGGYGLIKTYASSGIFLNLNDYMQYAPNYSKLYAEDKNLAMYDFEGATYGFVLYSDPSNIAQGPALVLRTDLLKKHGLEMPKTTEDLLTVMAKLKELYPESEPWTSRGNTGSLINRSAFILGGGYGMYFEPELGKWTFGQVEDSFKEVLSYLNRAYTMGVLDIDYATMNNQLWQEKMNTGTSFMYFENPGFSFGMTSNLRVTDPEAALELAPVPANSITGNARAYLYEAPEDAMYLISADTKNPELVVKFMDWCYSAEGITTCCFGKEGVTFAYDENGEPQFLPEYVQQFATASSPSYALQSALGSCQLGFAPQYLVTKFDDSLNKALGIEQDEITKRYYELFETDPAYIPGVIKPPFTEAENETITDVMTPINTYLTAEYDKYIMGEKSIEEWSTVVAKLQEMGIQKVIDIYNTAYDRALSN